MSKRLPEPLERAFAPLRRKDLDHAGRVHACLSALHGALLAMEWEEAHIFRFLDRALVAYEMRDRVESTLRGILFDVAGAGAKFARAPMAATAQPRSEKSDQWDLKELDNRLAPVNETLRTPKPFRFSRPMADRMPRRQINLRQRKAFETNASTQDADSMNWNLDRDTVDQLLRNIGKGLPDFGPEPPGGGQPALL